MTPTLRARFVRATILVALASSIALAAIACGLARVAWTAREAALATEEARHLDGALRREADEDRESLEAAAPDAFAEAGQVGMHLEAWSGGTRIAALPDEPVLGPPAPAGEPLTRAGWIVRAHHVGGGPVILVGIPQAQGRRAWRVFGWSLLLATPACLVVAGLVGAAVARTATAPLTDLARRVEEAPAFGTLAAPAGGATSHEADVLEQAYARLVTRLHEHLEREIAFAANASHELRTPLTKLRLHAERAAEAGPAEARPHLDAIVGEADRLARLVDSLLVLARADAGAVDGEIVNLADLVRQCAARHDAVEGPAEIATASIDAPDEALVRGSERLLSMAVGNLLDNAFKFGVASAPIRVSVAEHGGRVAMRVTTPGARVAAEDEARLFERFWRDPRSRAERRGHGLGLPLARHVARQHGGDVILASGAGEDVSFVLDLPAAC